MPNHIFLPDNLLDVCRGWQEVVDAEPTTKAKVVAAEEAVASVQSVDGFRGTQKIIVKSDLALLIKDEQEEIGISYRDITAKGWLGKVVSVRVPGYVALAWSLYDACVLDEPDIDATANFRELIRGNLRHQTDGTRRPIILPVGFINYALCAA